MRPKQLTVIKVVFAVAVLVTGAWVGIAEISPKNNGRVELVLEASGRAKVYLWANRRAKVPKEDKERPSLVVERSDFRQVVVFPLTTRLVEELSVEFQELDPGGVQFHAVKLFDRDGTLQWESRTPGPVWKLPQRVSLAKERARQEIRWWWVGLATALGAAGAWVLVRSAWAQGAWAPGPVGYGLGVLAGFVSAGAAYFGLIHLAMDHLWVDQWVHNVLVAKRMALLQTDSPRTVAIGGSSGLFGVKAELLSRESGTRVINGATHAGIVTDYYLDLCRHHLRPGDSCLIHLEYTKWEIDNVTSWLLEQAVSWGRLEQPPRILELTPARKLAAMPPETLAAAGLAALYPKALSPTSPVRIELPGGEVEWLYGGFSPGVSAHGDLIFSTLAKSAARPEATAYIPTRPFNREAESVQRVEAFFAWAASRQIKVYVTFPATIQHEMADFRKPEFRVWIDSMLEWLREHGAVPLGRPEDYAQPLEAFLDTHYHLTEEGRELHTRRILQQLQAVGWPGK